MNDFSERVQIEAQNLLNLRNNNYSKFIKEWKNLRTLCDDGHVFARAVRSAFYPLRAAYLGIQESRSPGLPIQFYGDDKVQTMSSQEFSNVSAYAITIKYKKRNTYSKPHNLSAYWNLPGKGYTYIPDMETPQLISCAYWLRARLKERVADVSRGLAKSTAYSETDRIDSIISHAKLDDWSPSWRHIKAELIRRNLQTIIDEVES